jgi:hypothetical protein
MNDETIYYEVKALDEVEDDILDLMGFYEDIAGEKSAFRFRGAVDEALRSLDYSPKGHPMWEGNEDIRRLNMLSHNVAIIYIVNDDEYEVIAVKAFHTLQNPIVVKELIDGRIALAREAI